MQPDLHVHTQFSWDAPHGDMEASCRRALEIGLPALAFTEHADFVEGVHETLVVARVVGRRVDGVVTEEQARLGG